MTEKKSEKKEIVAKTHKHVLDSAKIDNAKTERIKASENNKLEKIEEQVKSVDKNKTEIKEKQEKQSEIKTEKVDGRLSKNSEPEKKEQKKSTEKSEKDMDKKEDKVELKSESSNSNMNLKESKEIDSKANKISAINKPDVSLETAKKADIKLSTKNKPLNEFSEKSTVLSTKTEKTPNAEVKKPVNFESQKYTYSSDFQRNKSKSSKDGKPSRRDGRGRRDDRNRESSDIENTLVCVRRVTKVVKGGRTFRFSATVAVGDKKGKVGIAIGKASEVPSAIDKATAKAKKNMQKINLVNGTIPHETKGKFCTTSILMLPAKPGTGVIAGGSARAVLELAGITDIVTKVHGSTNSINVVKATFQGLIGIKTREQIAEIRGKAVEDI